jgi:hypothetical protein
LKFEVIQHAEDRFREHVLLGRQILANFPSGTPLAVAVMSVANYAIQVRLQSIDATLAAGYLAHFNACDSFEARKGVALTFKSSRIGKQWMLSTAGKSADLLAKHRGLAYAGREVIASYPMCRFQQWCLESNCTRTMMFSWLL